MDRIEKIFKFATAISRLKEELRFKSVKNFKGDTVASHTWRLSLLIVIIAQELRLKIDVLQATKIALVHDLPEAITGDLDAYISFNNKEVKKQKNNREKAAMLKIKKLLPDDIGKEIYDLWEDYSQQNSLEAKFVCSLNKVEGIWSYLELEKGDFNNSELVAKYHLVGYKLFPDLKPVLDYVKSVIKKEFKERNLEWKKEYDNYK